MAPQDVPVASSNGAEEADLAKVTQIPYEGCSSQLTPDQAFQELAKGERTATALENQLQSMEAKIEALLAQAEKDQEEVQRAKAERAGPSTDGKPASNADQ